MEIAKNHPDILKFIEAVKIYKESVRQLSSADIEPKLKQKIINYTNRCTYKFDSLSNLLQESKTDDILANLRTLKVEKLRDNPDRSPINSVTKASVNSTSKAKYSTPRAPKVVKSVTPTNLVSNMTEVRTPTNQSLSPKPSGTSATTCSYSEEDLLVLKASSKINNKVSRLLLELLNA